MEQLSWIGGLLAMAYFLGSTVLGPYANYIYNLVAIKKLYEMKGDDAPGSPGKSSTSVTAIKYNC